MEESKNKGVLAREIKEQWKLAKDPRLYLLGPNLWLVDVASREEQRRIMALKEDLMKDHLHRLCEWTPNMHAIDPSIWITITGVPVHIWREEIFRALANFAGTVAEMDLDAFLGERLDRARVKILPFPTFQGELSIPIMVEKQQYLAQIKIEKAGKQSQQNKDKKKRRETASRRKVLRIWREKKVKLAPYTSAIVGHDWPIVESFLKSRRGRQRRSAPI
ncbi:hypothetical protein H6P81_000912 [Aristolochia fimbriata]|uniref:DUF4283 domain-containing protein n=1 Tax=Aristolochia fimbriata TaxID=158543 RepID=A0AAV7F658_ARIFI|nr:hypothetical protein H6P81_000912 [Aristolochia fimbriata]